jgi:hypothetical protein
MGAAPFCMVCLSEAVSPVGVPKGGCGITPALRYRRVRTVTFESHVGATPPGIALIEMHDARLHRHGLSRGYRLRLCAAAFIARTKPSASSAAAHGRQVRQ